MMVNELRQKYEVRKLRDIRLLNTIDFFYTLFIYTVFGLYCADLIGFPILVLGVQLYVIRAFNLRHEKVHLPNNSFKSIHRWFTDLITVPYLPYQEPFMEKRRKHLSHHRTHLGSKHNQQKLTEDPHQLLEDKNIFKSFICCLFYEEIMFVLDYKKYGKICLDRKVAMVYSISLSLAIGYFLGWQNLLALMLAYRINMTLSWFFFSYILHIPAVYSGDIAKKLPEFVTKSIEWFVGSSGATTIAYHVFHHTDLRGFLKVNRRLS